MLAAPLALLRRPVSPLRTVASRPCRRTELGNSARRRELLADLDSSHKECFWTSRACLRLIASDSAAPRTRFSPSLLTTPLPSAFKLFSRPLLPCCPSPPRHARLGTRLTSEDQPARSFAFASRCRGFVPLLSRGGEDRRLPSRWNFTGVQHHTSSLSSWTCWHL